jgi:hypothetical protein
MMQEFIEQILKVIVSGAGELDPVRRRMFLIWLESHTSQVRCTGDDGYAKCLAEKLPPWLGAMSVAGILWEYRLVMGEIEWWSGLEKAAIERMGGVQA